MSSPTAEVASKAPMRKVEMFLVKYILWVEDKIKLLVQILLLGF